MVIRAALFLILLYWLVVDGMIKLIRLIFRLWDRWIRIDDGSNQI